MKLNNGKFFTSQENEDEFYELKKNIQSLKGRLHKNFMIIGRDEEAKRYGRKSPLESDNKSVN